MTAKLSGSGRLLDISVSSRQVVAPTTYIYKKSHTTVEIRNNGDTPVKYAWKRMLSRVAEAEERAKISEDIDRQEADELRMLEQERDPSDKKGDESDEDDDDDEDYMFLVAREKITNKFKQAREQAVNRLLFDHPNFSVDHTKGEIFPGGIQEVTIGFCPDNALTFEAEAALEIDGLIDRIPVTFKGVGLGPKAKFLFDQLDIGRVYINAVHRYSIELENIGQIDVNFKFEMDADSPFTCRPAEGRLGALQNNTRSILFTFVATKKGRFEETVECWLKGNQQPLTVTFRGKVIGPTFDFEQKHIDWGNVSYGFLQSREISVANSSEIPMRFSLRVPEDEKYTQREFRMIPEMQTILPHGIGKVRVDFVPQTKKKYSGYRIVIDVVGVGKALKAIPMQAVCKVPEFSLGLDELDFGQVSINHPYHLQLPLVNNSDLPARFEVKGQPESTLKLAHLKFDLTDGFIKSNFCLHLGVTIFGKKLGEHEFPIQMRIPGSARLPVVVIKATVVGPKIIADKKRLVFKSAKVLEPSTQSLVFSNLSVIPAPFKAFVRKKKSCFRLSTTEATIPPGDKIELKVTVIPNDFGAPIKDRIMIVVEEGDILEIPLSANGEGTTIYCPEDIKEVDMGHVFTVDRCKRRFVFENRGKRSHNLTWVFLDPKFTERENIQRSTSSKKMTPEEEAASHPTPCHFIVRPKKVLLNPNMAISFQVEGFSPKPGSKKENWLCLGSVQGDPRPFVIHRTTLKANFVVPLLELSEKTLEFIQLCEPSQEILPGKLPLSLRNVSPLPLVFSLRCPTPFSVDASEFSLEPGESATVQVHFSAEVSEEKQSMKIRTNLLITYRDHTQKDKVVLRGEVHFPNLKFSSKVIDFGCVLNETYKRMAVEVENISRVVTNYNWSFLAPETLGIETIAEDVKREPERAQGIVPEYSANEVFDIVPIGGCLLPGEKEVVEFVFYGHTNSSHETVAICEVEGGPEYTLSLKGQASAVLYTLDSKELNFGDNAIENRKTMELTLRNVGCVDFKFHVDNSPLKLPVFKIFPSGGIVGVGKKRKIGVRYLGGIPSQIDETFKLCVACFRPMDISLIGTGLFPQVSVELPRDPQDSMFQPRLDYAIDTILLDQINSTENMEYRIQTPVTATLSTRNITTVSTRRADLKEQPLTTMQLCVREADRLFYFDTCRAFAMGRPPDDYVDLLTLRPLNMSKSKKGKRQDKLPSPNRRIIPPIGVNAPNFVISRHVVDFGHVILGSKKSVVFHVSNVGGAPALVEYNRKDLIGSMFDIQGPSSTAVPPQNYYNLKLVCAPRAGHDQPGASEMLLPLHIKKAPTILIRLRTVVEVPTVEVSTVSLNFGKVYAGMRKVQSLTLRNNNPVEVKWDLSLASTKPVFLVQPRSGTINANSSVDVCISFTPTKAVSYKTSLSLAVKMSTSVITIGCKGQGLVKTLRLEPAKIKMGPLLPYQKGNRKVVRIHNDASEPLEIVSLDFDIDLREEQRILRGIEGYKNGALYLEPRGLGEPLPSRLRRQYHLQQNINQRLDEERKKRAHEEQLSHAFEVLTAAPQDAKRVLTEAISPLNPEQLYEAMCAKNVYITRKHAFALVKSFPNPKKKEVLNHGTLINEIDRRMRPNAARVGENDQEEVGELQSTCPSQVSDVDPLTIDSRNILIVGGPMSGKSTLAKILAERLGMPQHIIRLDEVVQFFLDYPDPTVVSVTGEDDGVDMEPAVAQRLSLKMRITARVHVNSDEPVNASADSKGEDKKGDPEIKKGDEKGDLEGEKGDTEPSGKLDAELFAEALIHYLSLSETDLSQFSTLDGCGKEEEDMREEEGTREAEEQIQKELAAIGDQEDAQNRPYDMGVIIDGLDCSFLGSPGEAAKAVQITFDKRRSVIPSERDPDAHEVALKRVKSVLPHGDEMLPGETDDARFDKRTARLNVFVIRTKWSLISHRLAVKKEVQRVVICDEKLQEALEGFHELEPKALRKLKSARRKEYEQKLQLKNKLDIAKKAIDSLNELERKLRKYYIGDEVKISAPMSRSNSDLPVISENQDLDAEEEEDAKLSISFERMLCDLEDLGRTNPVLASIGPLSFSGPKLSPYSAKMEERRNDLDEKTLKRLIAAKKHLLQAPNKRAAPILSRFPWVRFKRVRINADDGPEQLALKMLHFLRKPFTLPKQKVIGLPPVMLQAYRRPDSSLFRRKPIDHFTLRLAEEKKSEDGNENAAANEEDTKSRPSSRSGTRPGTAKRNSKGSTKEADIGVTEPLLNTLAERPKTRWTIPAKSSIALEVDFISPMQGRFDVSLGFMIVGGTKEYPLICTGICAVPQISNEPRSIFMRRSKTQRSRAIFHKQYIMDQKIFKFGPLLVGKRYEDAKETSSKSVALGATYSDTWRISNTGVFDCRIDFTFLHSLDQTSGKPDDSQNLTNPGRAVTTPFHVEPSTLDLKVDEVKEITIWAFPKEPLIYRDSLICSILDNPIPVMFNVSCEGTRPLLDLSTERLEFSRLLVGQTDYKEVTLSNPTKLPVKWLIHYPGEDDKGKRSKSIKPRRRGKNDKTGAVEGDPKEIKKYLRVLPAMSGIVKPMASSVLRVEFEAKVEKRFEAPLSISFQDVGEVFPLESKRLDVVVEGFNMSIRPEWPEEHDGGVDFGVVKVNQPVVRKFNVENNGRYPVTFQIHVNPRKRRFYREILRIDPMEGKIEAATKLEFKLHALARREVSFDNSSDVKLLIFEPETKDKQPALPIRMCFQSVFSKFSIMPNQGIDFGPLEIGAEAIKTIEISNTGVFAFEYQIVEAGSQFEALEEKFDLEEKKIERKPRKRTAPKPRGFNAKGAVPSAQFGPFHVTGVRGSITPGQKMEIKVQFVASSISEFNNSLEIDICQRNKAANGKVVYELLGEGCSPGIVTDDVASIFEEQAVLRRLDPSQPLTRNVFTSDEPHRVFHFAPVIANGKAPLPSERFRISNPFKISCNVNIKILQKNTRGTMDQPVLKKKSKDFDPNTPVPSTAFMPTPEALHIPPHEHRFVSVRFKPNGLATCVAKFVAEVEGGSQESSKCLKFDLTGEGILPSISVEDPIERDEKSSAVVVKFQRAPLRSVGRRAEAKTRYIVLRNEMTVPATARFDVENTTEFSFSGRGRLITLAPRETATLSVGYHPASPGKHECKIVMKILQNPFEMTIFHLMGDSFLQDVTLEGLETRPNERGEDLIHFGNSPVGSENTKTFKMSNTSQFPCRFEWQLSKNERKEVALPKARRRMSIKGRKSMKSHKEIRSKEDFESAFRFSPSVGHLQPGQIKEINLTFCSMEARAFNHERAVCSISRIRYVSPEEKAEIESARVKEKKSAKRKQKSKRAASRMPTVIAEHSTIKSNNLGATRSIRVGDWDESMGISEPNFVTVVSEDIVDSNQDTEMELLMCAVADQCRYKLDDTIEHMARFVRFAPTMMFQVRVFRFTVKNTSNVAMPYKWAFADSEQELAEALAADPGQDTKEEPDHPGMDCGGLTLWDIRGVGVDKSKAFDITPAEGVIPPLQDQIFQVKFAPMCAERHQRLLGIHIDHLKRGLDQPIIKIEAVGRRPKCHFELSSSDYLRAGRRPADVPNPDGQLVALDPSRYQVIEFKSLGINVRNTKRFFIVNPTNKDYSYEWQCEGISMRISDHKQSSSGLPNPFRCLTQKGQVMSGRKAEMEFHYLPQSEALVESMWRFRIKEQDINVPVLLVGQVSEPDVTFDLNHFNFKHTLVGTRGKGVIHIINNEPIDFPFALNCEVENKSRPVLDIKPMSGIVPARCRIPLRITFYPREERVYNYNVQLEIKRKSTKVSINIKGSGFKILSQLESQVEVQGDGGVQLSRHLLSPSATSKIDFGTSYISETRIKKLVLTNIGQFSFSYEWALGKTKFLAIKPSYGKLPQGDSVSCDMIFKSDREVSFSDLLVYLKIGPQSYTLSLTGRAKKPRLQFSFQKWDFGPCFLSREGVPSAEHILRVVNHETTNIEIDCAFNPQQHLTIDHQANVLAPGEDVLFKLRFYPQEAKKYHDDVVFEVNGSYKVGVIVTGEGVPIRLNLTKESDKLVNLGEIRSGQHNTRVVKLLNSSRIACRFRLSATPSTVEKLRKLHGHVDTKAPINPLDDPLATRLEELCTTYRPSTFLTLRPRQSAKIEFTFCPDRLMPNFREDVMIDVDGHAQMKLLTLMGGCYGVGARLDTTSVPFGAIVKGTIMVKTIQIENTSEAGIRFAWEISKAGPHFSLSPISGFVPPRERANVQVSFHPQDLDNDIRMSSIGCLIDNQQHPNMYITLTGACVLPRTDAEVLRFTSPVRQECSQQIRIQNPTARDWDALRVQISNRYWYGKPTLRVPRRGEAKYEVFYKPLSLTNQPRSTTTDVKKHSSQSKTDEEKDNPAASNLYNRPKEHKGSLFFALPTGNAVLYKLLGLATKAKAESTIKVHCKCKRTEVQALSVQNWLGTPQVFDVNVDVKGESDGSVTVSGPETLDVPGSATREYKLKFYSYKEGITEVTVVFLNRKTGESLHFRVKFTCESVQRKRLPAVKTRVRRRKVITEEIHNPLENDVSIISFSCEDPDVFVPTPITIPGRGSGRIRISYNPLTVKKPKDDIKLSVHSKELGEFAYLLSLSATEASLDGTMRFDTDLGSKTVQTFRFKSYGTTQKDAEYDCKIKGTEFTIQKSVYSKNYISLISSLTQLNATNLSRSSPLLQSQDLMEWTSALIYATSPQILGR